MRPAIKSFTGCSDAAAMVEFAVAAGFFFTIVLAILNFGYAAWERNSVTADAREGARYAIVHGSASGRVATTDSVQNYVRSKSSLGSSVLVSTVWDPVSKEPGSVVTVTVTHVRPKLFLPDTVRSTSSMIVVF
jgi:Flp pilus assembly protein TadG